MDNKEDLFGYYLTINLNSICRVCLGKSNTEQKLTPIFDTVKYSNVSNLIMACASVQIIEHDGLPSHLCEDCLTQLQIAFQFKTKCEQSDLRLREYLCLPNTTTCEKQEISETPFFDDSVPKGTNEENVFNIITTSMTAENPPTSLNVDSTIDTDSLLISSTVQDAEEKTNVNYVFKPNFVINIENIPEDIMTKSIIIPNFTEKSTTYAVESEDEKIKSESLLENRNSYLEDKKENCQESKISIEEDFSSEFIILHKKHKYEKENKILDKDIKSETKELKYLTKRQRKFNKHVRKRIICKQNSSYTPKLPKKHQCDTCGKVFKAKQGLIQHLRIHSGERPYLCHLCNKRFINGGHLHTHMRTHTGEKNHKCTECTKAFATAQQLQKHIIAIHTEDRPYQCSYCPKRCASSSNLTTHIRIHTGEKNYHCDRCPKAFSTKGQLLQHILIHTGQKPFLCEFCQKRFTQRAHLTRHMKMHRN